MSTAEHFPPWPDLIAEMGTLRLRVEEVEPLLAASIPHVAATEDQLRAAEARLGCELDTQHREFLSYGNGWPDFFYGTRLLAADELGQGPVWADIMSTLEAFYSATPPGTVPPLEQMCPISHSEDTSSVFAIWLHGPRSYNGHPVFWLPWEEGTEIYENFFAFFRDVYQAYEDELATDQ